MSKCTKNNLLAIINCAIITSVLKMFLAVMPRAAEYIINNKEENYG